ncbi:heavy-metal-associated domain-containing protein [Streptomyces sp. SKN60]|uniref:heavy-metal-associated domain-containing protein n=1 Tax=Streptomyces sp. SKN60 TaxID=2855506 RepID=UPI0022474825|nr:heavy-metal-associated domain-containing protein [Streptomyces sp. SKN60]
MQHPAEHHDHGTPHGAEPGKERSTAVLDVRGLAWASQQSTVTAVLGRRPGVLEVEVNPVAQAATVVFDPRRTSLAELRRWVTECGYHCAGQSVPSHICDPMAEPDPAEEAAEGRNVAHEDHAAGGTATAPPPGHVGHAAHEAATGAEAEAMPSPHELMGHGGHEAMSMADMVADMRNRFLVALVFSIPIVIWSPIGEDVFGWHAPVPFGLRQDVWALLLSLPVIFYSCSIFFDGQCEPCGPARST